MNKRDELTPDERQLLKDVPTDDELGASAFDPHEHKCSLGHCWHHDPARMVAELKAKGAANAEIGEAYERSHQCPVCHETQRWTRKGEPTFIHDGLRTKVIAAKPEYVDEPASVARERLGLRMMALARGLGLEI